MYNEQITDEELNNVRTGPPWERRDELGFFTAVFKTIKGVLLNPTRTFADMKTEGGLGTPIIYALILGSIGGIIGLVWQGLFSSISSVIGRAGVGEFAGLATFGAIKFIIIVIFMPLFIVVGLFISSGICHLCLMIVGGANKSYETTFRVFAYTAGSTALIQIVPICGALVAGIWALVCEIIGLREAHETTTGRAVLAILLPVIVCCGLVLVIMMIAGLGLFMIKRETTGGF